jgi:hypothetical protein
VARTPPSQPNNSVQFPKAMIQLPNKSSESWPLSGTSKLKIALRAFLHNTKDTIIVSGFITTGVL